VVAGHRGAVLHFLAAAAGLAWRKRWPIVRVVLAVAVVSFLVNVTTVHPFRAAAFYSPLSRFWELMVGGILACMRLKPPPRRARGAAISSRCWAWG
jgi:peptidoglycan/LPS O-acetylase OafA/YrhL